MGKEPENAFEKAAACEAQAKRTKDRAIQAKFRALRDSWIRLANNAQLAGDEANAARLKGQEERSGD